MDAKELRKKLEEGLKPDVSGKTTPIQRLNSRSLWSFAIIFGHWRT